MTDERRTMMKLPKPYRLTKYDRERQGMLFADPHIIQSPPPPLPPLTGPQPSAHVRGAGLCGVLADHGEVLWSCAHVHRHRAGAVACAWRQRGVLLAAESGT
jgi:hypothetical protein